MTSTTWLAKESLHPDVILGTRTRLDPLTIHWLAHHELNTDECTSTDVSACCDGSTMRCGITSKDIEMSFSTQAARPELSGMLREANKAVESEQNKGSSGVLSPEGFKTDYSLSDCQNNNFVYNEKIDSAQGTSQHSGTGSHSYAGVHIASCSYSNPPNNAVHCLGYVHAQIYPSMNDQGAVWVIPFCHAVNTTSASADGAFSDTSPTVTAVAGGAAKNCFACACSMSMTASGPGLSITFPPDSVWFHTDTFTASCPVMAAPQTVAGEGPPPDPSQCDPQTGNCNIVSSGSPRTAKKP